jgi:hypothetical protein
MLDAERRKIMLRQSREKGLTDLYNLEAYA